MKLENSNFLTALQLQEQYRGQANRLQQSGSPGEEISFQDILNSKTEESRNLRFSKHASFRLQQRGINLTSDQMERLESGADRAGSKGIRDSLVIVDELAFIVNVPNKTVVTAMDSAEAETNVFTNIDGAVIM